MQATIDLKQFVEASDASGAITMWNPAAQRMFGFTETEALGRSLDIIMPQCQQQRHWDGYQKTVATDGNDVLRVPAVHKNGHKLSIAFTAALLHAPDKKVAAIVAVIRDETARFTEDRNLRKRLMELESQLAPQASAP
ncbi:PAS domain-containing protein [Polaromonas sp. AET17H-212]|jgi:PAS domain S-box-containing protein|uniref:PAS domain-containing protein n=1 Tax=Polaromonas sp. AET17H-212 TaxID=1977061 RepID=UPI0008B86483|nr:PAS domain-containing protein [Polaromonas sp. AET17H-212]OGB23845.1 MAG: histidine kinase [Burkholderiales bacterium RIFCSPLOWO2_02_FULL_57_36]